MMTSHFNVLPLSKIHSTMRHWSVASHAQIYGVNMSYLSQYLYSLSCTGSFWQQSMQENLQHDLAHFKGCLAHRWKVTLSLDMLSWKNDQQELYHFSYIKRTSTVCCTWTLFIKNILHVLSCTSSDPSPFCLISRIIVGHIVYRREKRKRFIYNLPTPFAWPSAQKWWRTMKSKWRSQSRGIETNPVFWKRRQSVRDVGRKHEKSQPQAQRTDR